MDELRLPYWRAMLKNVSYTDDMVLMAPSVRGLLILLKICQVFAHETNMNHNQKTAVLLSNTEEVQKTATRQLFSRHSLYIFIYCDSTLSMAFVRLHLPLPILR